MPDYRPISSDPERWRTRAEEMRTKRDSMSDKISRDIHERLAKDFDRMAELAEQRAKPK